MNIVVVGLGSMGKRRIRLLKKYYEEYNVIGVDLSEDRRNLTETEFGIETNEDLDIVLKTNKIDCVMVCTSPLNHNSIINLCLKNDLHVFTELNLVTDGYEENIKLAKDKNKILFLSSTFLYRREISEIRKLVSKQEKSLNYIYHIGQYLPDWHPWESYKDFFVENKKTNGCREIFAIELPWIMNVFGRIKDMVVKKNKISDLDIDYNDNYMLIIEHESGHRGMLSVDIVSRKPVRNLEIIGEYVYISWDGSPLGLKQINIETKEEETFKLYESVEKLDDYSNFVIENAYYSEIETFFDVIENNVEVIYDFEKDKEVLELIDRIED